MAINILRIGLLITTAQFFFSASCNKEKTSCLSSSVTYSFDATAEWTQQREVYNIGDTIYLYSMFPKNLLDKISNVSVDYSNSVGVQGDIRINYLDTISRQAQPAKDSFNFHPVIGTFSARPVNQNQGINFNYSETTSNYEFRGAIICRKKGVYGIGLADNISNGLRGKNCTKAAFSMIVTNNEKHFNLYQYALGFPPDADAIKRGYCFRVQ